jgi:hypothetical protein
VVQRLEMVRRIADEIAGYVVELGVDGRLLALQLDELMAGVDADRTLVVRDYLPVDQPVHVLLRSVDVLHNFYVPVSNQRVSRPRPRRGSAQSELADQLEEEREKEGRFKVWGMTARVLVDAARVAYGEEPEMEHNLDYGDANIIMLADAEGSFAEISDPPRKEAETEKGKM